MNYFRPPPILHLARTSYPTYRLLVILLLPGKFLFTLDSPIEPYETGLIL